MKKNRHGSFAVLLWAGMFLIALPNAASAQGRGRGQGRPASGNSGVAYPSGVGVDKGVSTSSERSKGRADIGRETASSRSNGRSDTGFERARLRQENSQRASDELNRHPQMAKRLRTTAKDLRDGYEAALVTNPGLPFGQYVAASRLGANLGKRNPNITRDAILAGLEDGRSIGQTLQDLGLSEREAKDAKKKVEREIKDAKR